MENLKIILARLFILIPGGLLATYIIRCLYAGAWWIMHGFLPVHFGGEWSLSIVVGMVSWILLSVLALGRSFCVLPEIFRTAKRPLKKDKGPTIF